VVSHEYAFLIRFFILFCSLAQATLASPLSKASQEARSPFLKAEAFRLLSILFVTKPDTEASEWGKAAAKGLEEVRDDFLTSMEAALQDVEMRKAKRVRVVLKALEKFVAGLSSPCSGGSLSKLDNVKSLLEKLGESDSQAVQASCAKLMGEIDTKASELKTVSKSPNKHPAPGSNSKKSKKKKNKR
jgi:hypothetical protein